MTDAQAKAADIRLTRKGYVCFVRKHSRNQEIAVFLLTDGISVLLAEPRKARITRSIVLFRYDNDEDIRKLLEKLASMGYRLKQ